MNTSVGFLVAAIISYERTQVKQYDNIVTAHCQILIFLLFLLRHL